MLNLDLHIHDAGSLKDKRSVVNSILTRVRSRFNVSAAQLDDHDLWQSASLAVVVVSNAGASVDSVLNRVRDLVECDPRCDVTHCSTQKV